MWDPLHDPDLLSSTLHERCRLCSMGIMKRSLPLLACVLLLAPAMAQTRSPNEFPKQPQRTPDVPERRGVALQEGSPMAGSPSTRDSLAAAFFYPDTALANILLDHSQAERITELDNRYVERLQQLGTTDGTDAGYRKLWAARRDELRVILTPVQFKRWQELNGEAGTEP